MANIREKNLKSGVKATPAEAAADAPAASRTIPQSSSAALDAAERAKPSKAPTAKPETAAPKAAAKAATPPEAKSPKSPPKRKWVNALSTPASPAKPRRGAAGRSGAEALDQWVNAMSAEPPQAEPRGATESPSAATESPSAAPEPRAAARQAATTVRKSSTAPRKAPSAKQPAAPMSEPEPPPASPPPSAAANPAVLEPAAAPPPARPAAVEPAPAPKPAPPASPAPAAARAADAFGLGSPYPMPNVEALARNVASAIEHAGKAMAAYMRPREAGEIKTTIADDVGEMVRSLGHVAEYYMSDPARAIEAQTALTIRFIDLWAATLQRFQGAPVKSVAEPDGSDKQFSDAEWRDNPFFDFLKQAYVVTSDWADDLVRRADELEPRKRDKARFYLRQVTAALSPSNFVATNPELLRTTLAESGENLARGLKMLAEDIHAGRGHLRIRQVDARPFKLGVNMAATPGKVIYRNELMELIQYEPTTPKVYKRPLLYVPAWINKYYILDLNPEKSFVRWAVAQGLTVFAISWVNPDERHADKGLDAYMHEGILAALTAIEDATGEIDVTAIGYCVGGTLLSVTLAYMAAVDDRRVSSATLFASLVDFTDVGDLKVFIDAEQLKAVEERMAEQGYLEGSHMAAAFNMLRPNDLIWSYYVNNYLKGKEPMPFDLLVWNSNSTRMPAANHNFYLRHCYLQNDLSNGRMVLSGKTLDLGRVTIPMYVLSSREDHIAPARGVFKGAQCFGGPVRFVTAGSGHIAGVVNPADKPKYQFWTDGPPEGDFKSWIAAAKETPGSWWPDWVQWVTAQAPEKAPARKPGEGKLKAICDAPGEYVRVKA